MPEDKLTEFERVRLEAFSQALNSLAHTASTRPTMAEIYARAEEIEAWLRKANPQ